MNKTWLGYGFGWLEDPRLWTPWGAPAPGDFLSISHGVPFLGDGTFGSSTAITHVGLLGTQAAPPALLLWNEDLSNVVINNQSNQPGDYAPYAGQVVVAQNVVLGNGSAIVAASNVPRAGTAMTVWLDNDAVLNSSGVLGANPFASLTVEGAPGSLLKNNGLIAAQGGHVTIDADIAGSGTLFAGVGYQQGGVMELGDSVGAGQVASIQFGTVKVDHPNSFLGTVTLSEGALALEGLDAASWSVSGDGTLLALLNAAGSTIDLIRMVPHPTEQIEASAFSDPTRGSGTLIFAVPLQTGAVAAVHGTVQQHA